MPPSSNIISSTYNMIAGRNDNSTSTVYKSSKEIANYVVKKQLGQKQKWNKIGERMFELCVDMKLKHEPFFDSIGTRLNLNRDTIDECSKSLMGEILIGGCNYGRMVSLFTLCMVLAEHCSSSEELNDKVEAIINNTAEIHCEHSQWFETNHGWDGFMDFFSNPADKLWKGFVLTTVGLGAVAGLLYANS